MTNDDAKLIAQVKDNLENRYRGPSPFCEALSDLTALLAMVQRFDNDKACVDQLRAEIDGIMKELIEQRKAVRDLLNRLGIRSNPGWTAQDVIDGINAAIRKVAPNHEPQKNYPPFDGSEGNPGA